MNCDVKSNVVMEIKKDDRSYCLIIPHGAPYGELYDALFKMLQDVVEMSKTAVESAKPAEMPVQIVSDETSA